MREFHASKHCWDRVAFARIVHAALSTFSAKYIRTHFGPCLLTLSSDRVGEVRGACVDAMLELRDLLTELPRQDAEWQKEVNKAASHLILDRSPAVISAVQRAEVTTTL
jgi:hypothetical protein